MMQGEATAAQARATREARVAQCAQAMRAAQLADARLTTLRRRRGAQAARERAAS